jgi:sec-independent protein translocase protein TatC
VNYEMLNGQRRNAIIAITLVSGLVAPPDVMSMLLMMTPLYLFFEGAVQVIRFMEKKKTSLTGG